MPKKLAANLEETHGSTPIFITAYGEFWSPDLVNWEKIGPREKRWRLLGIDGRGKTIDCYEQRGVYVLYQDYEPVYVGMADRQSIGIRLQLHRESKRKGPRWDRFSWFGIRAINKNGSLRKPTLHAHSPTAELIATLEALLIMAINPRLNQRREKFRNAIQLLQSDEDRPIPDNVRRLVAIEEKLDSLLKLRGTAPSKR
jgi:hypothetical protein